VVAVLSEYLYVCIHKQMVLNNHGKSCRCLARPVIQVIGSRLPKEESSFHIPGTLFRNQMIKDNASFNLLPSQHVQDHTFMWEHLNISPLILLL
jgi:hypothetical protein